MGELSKECLHARCDTKPINTYSQNQNKAENGIKENKRATRREHDKKKSPLCIWDYTNQYFAMIRSHTDLKLPQLMNKVPETIMTGQTLDILHLMVFDNWEVVKFMDRASFPNSHKAYGR